MFQRIGYDRLVGHRFSKAQTVTFDLAGERMIFGRGG